VVPTCSAQYQGEWPAFLLESFNPPMQMPRYDSRKQSTQSADAVSDSNAAGLDARKKPRMVDNDPSVGEYLFSSVHHAVPQTHFIDDTGTQAHCRSSRTNKGHGGQIAQLHNIECIQTESTAASKTSRTSQLEKATANEPLNPMAPERPRPKVRTKTSQFAYAPAGENKSGLQSVCNVSHLYGCRY